MAGPKIQLPPAGEIAVTPVHGYKPVVVPSTVIVTNDQPKPKLNWVVEPSTLGMNKCYTKFTVTATNNSSTSEYFKYLELRFTSGSEDSLFTGDNVTSKLTVSNVAIAINSVVPTIFVRDAETKIIWWRVVFNPKKGNKYITIPAGDSVSLEFKRIETGIVNDHIVEYFESWVDPEDLENPPAPSNSGYLTLVVKVVIDGA